MSVYRTRNVCLNPLVQIKKNLSVKIFVKEKGSVLFFFLTALGYVRGALASVNDM
jgi:hypothetical protein